MCSTLPGWLARGWIRRGRWHNQGASRRDMTVCLLPEAIRLLPELPGSDDDASVYTPAVLRAETAAVGDLVGMLAHAAESLRWATLVAHHAMTSPVALRSAGWTAAERRAVACCRNRLSLAVAANL